MQSCWFNPGLWSYSVSPPPPSSQCVVCLDPNQGPRWPGLSIKLDHDKSDTKSPVADLLTTDSREGRDKKHEILAGAPLPLLMLWDPLGRLPPGADPGFVYGGPSEILLTLRSGVAGVVKIWASKLGVMGVRTPSPPPHPDPQLYPSGCGE